jgi:predicted AlkP superfamily pyrophosphatase or phosphodiesterase
MDNTLSDDQVVDLAIEVLETQDPVFMRIHLQTPGGKGFEISQSTEDKPYYRNIFGPDSPYIIAVENADKLLGKFIAFLKESGAWEETVLIITSDHGQSKIGWHPMFDEDSWMTPLLFVGPGIAQGRRLSYFEHTDLASTIAALLGKNPPNTNGGAGTFIKEILSIHDVSRYEPSMHIKTLNNQIKEFNFLKARLIIASKQDTHFSNIVSLLENENSTPEPFYHQDRITDWYKAGSTAHLLEANENILKQMRQVLSRE